MPKRDTPDVLAWKEEARAEQQNIFLLLRDREWVEWDKSDTTILLRKIGLAMFGLSENLQEVTINQMHFKEVELIADVILGKAKSVGDIHFACIFIFGKIEEKQFRIPVFKVKGEENQTFFVDVEHHVYDNWSDYLDSNRLPNCMYCYPVNGLYQGNEDQVLVEFGSSSGDNSTTSTLADHYFYDLSVDLSNRKERMVYIWVLCPQAAAYGDVATEAVNAFNSDSNGSLNVNGLDTLYDLFSVVYKARKGTLTISDISNFTISVLLILNNPSLSNSAAAFIEFVQKHVLNLYCDDLTDPQIEELIRLSEQIKVETGETQIHKNMITIKVINRIGDKRDFFECLVTLRTDLDSHHVQLSSSEPGIININDKLHIAPSKLREIQPPDRKNIIEATQNLNAEESEKNLKQKDIEKILKSYRIKMQYQRNEAISQLKCLFNSDLIRNNGLETVKFENVMFFEDVTIIELDRLANMMADLDDMKNPKILEIAYVLAERRSCTSLRDYCNYVEFTAQYLSDLVSPKEEEYLKALKMKKTEHDVNKFDREYGIIGKRTPHFRNQIIDDFRNEKRERSFNALEQRYIELKDIIQPLNARIYPKFASDTSAVYHWLKHKVGDGRELTPEEYFEIASQLENEDLKMPSEPLTQQGDKRVITYKTSKYVGIVYKTLADGIRFLATLHVYSNKLSKKLKKQRRKISETTNNENKSA